jgi:hypothetical protein
VVEFRLLGPLEAVVDGASVRLGPPQQRALLTLLLLNANEVVSRDRIVDELWGERPPATAIKLVQVYVSALGKVLEPDVLVTRPPGYLLQVEPDAVDLDRFRRHLDEGGAALGAGAAAAAADHFRSALALWRGPALADFAFAPFAQAQIGRLDELRQGARSDRIEADLELGRGYVHPEGAEFTGSRTRRCSGDGGNRSSDLRLWGGRRSDVGTALLAATAEAACDPPLSSSKRPSRREILKLEWGHVPRVGVGGGRTEWR